MKVRFELLICFSILVLTGSGCNSKAPLPDNNIPDIGIRPEQMNTKVRLAAPEGWNTFKIDDEVILTLELVTEDQVVFPSGYGARLFIYQNDHWLEINNDMKYPKGEILVQHHDRNDPVIESAGLAPLLPDPNKPVTVRMILIGHIYRGGKVTSEKTASYIDVRLKP